MERNLNVGNDKNLFDIIEQVFALISGNQIDICTFSISDDGVRFLAHLDEKILNLKCRIIIDSSALKTKTNVIFSANKVAEVRFAPNHSKIILIRGEIGSAYIITSSNFNLTKRNELFLFGFEKEIVDQLSEFYENLWEDGIQQ
jgi:hypothetical protein